MVSNGTVNVFHLPFSFMLPQKVATERGYFADEGLSVDLVERDRADVDRKYIPADGTLVGDYDIDMYPICKWESIKRTWEMDDGKIVANGTFADLPYSVFTRPDSGIEEPADLADVPVGVNMRTGQEYTARRALEDHLPPEEVRLQHCGMPTDRLQALHDGDVDAVTLIDPHRTFAEELGFRNLLDYENHMGIVGHPDLENETLEAFLRAYRRAVEDINAEPEAFRDQYLELLTEEAATGLAPELFERLDLEAIRERLSIPRYEAPKPADRDELDAQLQWMQRRELVDGDADVDAIIAHL